MSSQDPKVPGIQYPILDPGASSQLVQAVKNIYDNLFYLRGLTQSNVAGNFTQEQLDALKQIITNQFISIINNNSIINELITNIVNNIFITGGAVEFGSHIGRLTLHASDPLGSMYFETDRITLYVMIDSPDRWRFAAGLMLGDISVRPADLGADDASFAFLDSTHVVLYVWDGTQWLQVSGDFGYWAPVTNGVPDNPELIFDTLGNCVVSFTPTP